MTDVLFGGEPLRQVAAYNGSTGLYIRDTDCSLYVVKHTDAASAPVYRRLLTVQSPHLAKIRAVQITDRGADVIREYVSGMTLEQVLESRLTLSPAEAVRILSDVCEGLAELHRNGLVHRDVNPNNIVIGGDGGATVIDYGITRAYDGEKPQDTMILGTPGYAAPEQFGFSETDAKTDIYAAGVLLNVMLTGELPSVRRAAGDLGKIVEKCTAIDARRRFDSMRSLCRALQKLTVTDTPSDRLLAGIPGLRSRHPAVVVLSAVGYCLFLLFSVAFLCVYKPGTFWLNFLSWLLMFLLPFLLFSDIFGCRRLIPGMAGAGRRTQRILCGMLGVLCILAGIILFGSINIPE